MGDQLAVLEEPRDEERTLLAGLRGGDEAALACFHTSLGPGLRGYLQARFGALGLSVEDVYAETFVKVWRAAERYDAQRGSLRSWVYAIARNTALDHLRRDRSARARLEQELLAFARGHAEFVEYAARVRAALASTRLAPLARRVVEADLRRFPWQDDASLAKELESSPASVQAQRAKAYRKLGLEPLKRRHALAWLAGADGQQALARRLGWRPPRKASR